ncbi:MAG: TonB family protein [Pyrinomonadaceae bacterium]
MAQPKYPAKARKLRWTGKVQVRIKIDKEGKVVWAKAVSGNKLFWPNCESAARRSTFQKPVFLGESVTVLTSVVYNFVSPR